MAGILPRLKMVQASFARTGFGSPGCWHSGGRLTKHHQRALQSNWKHEQHGAATRAFSAPPWQMFEKSLGFELETGCKNFQGRNLTFSEYVQAAAIEFDPPLSLHEDFNQLSEDLQKYPTLEFSGRKEVLQFGLSLVSRWAELEKRKLRVSKVQNPSSSDETEPSSTPAVEIKREAAPHQAKPGRTRSNTDFSQANNVSSSGSFERFNRLVAVTDKPEESGSSMSEDNKAGEKRIKISTAEQRRIFTEVANKGEDPMKWEKVRSAEQRSSEWLEGRKERLTASSFAGVLGLQDCFEPGKVQTFWEEKLGLREPFKGNQYTEWGTRMEPVALEDYKRFSGATVEEHGLKLLGEDEAHQWLAASPDGIITPSESTPDLFGMSSSRVGKGVLEIKCPHGKDPYTATPRTTLQEYYYPQVQGLMDVFDLEWCHLMAWTKNNGATIFWIPRNRAYWVKAYRLLAEFWWENVVPAKLLIAGHSRSAEEFDPKSIEQFRPELKDPRREEIKRETAEIVRQLKCVSQGVPEKQRFYY